MSRALLLLLCTVSPLVAAAEPAAPSGRPVVLELFTSEGCSSCPPAEELMARWQSQPLPGVQLVPLEFHVDYWDSASWRDAHSRPEWTARQRDYAGHGDGRVYTPELIVDGDESLVGSDGAHAAQAIVRAAQRRFASLGIVKNSSGWQITVGPRPGGRPAQLLLATTDAPHTTAVGGGENRGRQLVHTAAVASLTTIATVGAAGGTFEVALARVGDENALKRRAVAFLQDPDSRQIVGAGVLNP